MKELFTRAISGLIYALLLICSLYFQQGLFLVLFVFGIISLIEFNKLISLKSVVPYIIFTIFYVVFGYLCVQNSGLPESDEVIQILLVITIFVNLILIKDLFTTKKIPLFESKRFITTTFYLSSGFIFMLQIGNYKNEFTPLLLLGSFILIWGQR
jgi:phosphatidate cytidylyltransferase